MASRRPHRTMIAALGAVLVLAVTGCGGGGGGNGSDDESGSASEESTTTLESTTTTLTAEDEVLAAYARGAEAVRLSHDPADPNHPDLLATHSGQALARFQTVLTDYQLEGVSDVLISNETDPRVTELGETTAVVQDCLGEVLQLTDTATRQPRGEPRTYPPALVEFTFERVDGAWKIVDLATVEETC